MPVSHFLVQVEGGESEGVAQALKNAGLELLSIQETSAAIGGFVFTETNLLNTWNNETFLFACEESLGPDGDRGCGHLGFGQLSREQKHAFAKALAVFVNRCIEDEFLAEAAFSRDPLLKDIKAERCEDERCEDPC